MPSRRVERLNEQFRAEISELIRRELRDPGLTGLVSITTVDLSPDLRHARVYFSALGGEEERRRALAALQRAAGYLRHELAGRLTLRHVPELLFRPDTSLERGERIMGLLREIREEIPEGSPSEAAPTPEAGPAKRDPDEDR